MPFSFFFNQEKEVIFVSDKSIYIFSKKYKDLSKTMCELIIMVTAFLLIVMMFQGMSSQTDGYVSGYPTSYVRAGREYTNPLFSPCVSKRCAGGPYMYSSNPYLRAVCRGVKNEDLAQMACGKAFHGQPAHFDYSALSDGAWSNALCHTPTRKGLCRLW